MPRTGSGNYTKPYDDVVDGTTIEPLVYNGFVNDVATVLDDPTPIISGGTNAENTTDALYNLGAETATQVVENFDDHIWRPGSFRADAGKSGAPNGTAMFVGHALLNEVVNNPPTNNNVVLEARDMTSGVLYIRSKVAGVWFAWTPLPIPAAAGSTGQFQYNNAGAMAGLAGSGVSGGYTGLSTLFKVDGNGVVYSGSSFRTVVNSAPTLTITPGIIVQVNLLANRTYIFESELYHTLGPGGIRATIGGTAGITSLNAVGMLFADGVIKGQGALTAYDTLLFNTATTATTGILSRFSGTITTSSLGYIGIKTAQSTSNVTPITTLRGSWMKVTEVP